MRRKDIKNECNSISQFIGIFEGFLGAKRFVKKIRGRIFIV